MATFDQLSAEQRAIIELVVQRGRSYDALADVLQIEVPRVRELAREALSELTPVTSARVDDQWRGQVADYMLGQQSGPEATATRGHLKRSEPARTWALSLLDTLDELYATGSAPPVPDGNGSAPARRRAREEAPRARERDRDRGRDPDRERDRDRDRDREPLRREARDTATLSPAAEAVIKRRRLMGGLAGAAIVVVLILLVTGVFSSSSKKKTPAVKTPTTAAQAQIVGRIPLKVVKNGVKASGNAFILQRGTQRVLVVQAKLPPLTQSQRTAAYEVWLYNSRTDAASVGAQFTDAQGNYQGAGPLPANFTRFKFVDISRQPFQSNTGHSGDSILRGAFADIQPVQNPSGAPGTGTPPPTGGTPTTPGGTGTTP